jgi:hypothetical protein
MPQSSPQRMMLSQVKSSYLWKHYTAEMFILLLFFSAAFAHPAKLTEDHFKKLESTTHLLSKLLLLTNDMAIFRAFTPLMRRCVKPPPLVIFHLRVIQSSLDALETDFTFPTESRRRAEDILIETKATYHIQLFSGVNHGFATRGDPAITSENACACIL